MSEHIVQRRIYYMVFGALMFFTVLTVAVANVDLGGQVNTVIALTIAVIKATLVVLFFMHVRYSSRLVWVIIGASLFWLGIMFVLTMSDYVTRPSWQNSPGPPPAHVLENGNGNKLERPK